MEVPRTIGRVSNVLPIQGEKFYLRMLLNHRTGATSFSDMKVLNGTEYSIYKDVCLEMGLLEDDGEWLISMEEVSKYGVSGQIRATFAIILQYCQPTKPRILHDKFISFMSEDFIHKMKKEGGKDKLDEGEMEEVSNCVLRALDSELGQMGTSLANFPELPTPPPESDNQKVARVMVEETFNKADQEKIVMQLELFLSPGQAEVCEAVYQALHAAPGESKAINIINLSLISYIQESRFRSFLSLTLQEDMERHSHLN